LWSFNSLHNHFFFQIKFTISTKTVTQIKAVQWLQYTPS